MKKSFLTLVAALVLFNANVFAGSLRTGGKTLVESGRTTELASWLKDICGATGSRTSYTITTTPKTTQVMYTSQESTTIGWVARDTDTQFTTKLTAA